MGISTGISTSKGHSGHSSPGSGRREQRQRLGYRAPAAGEGPAGSQLDPPHHGTRVARPGPQEGSNWKSKPPEMGPPDVGLRGG